MLIQPELLRLRLLFVAVGEEPESEEIALQTAHY